jgi:hypothetical protein
MNERKTMSQSFRTSKKSIVTKQAGICALLAFATLLLLYVGWVLLAVSVYQEEIETDLPEEYHDSPVAKKYVWKSRDINLTNLGVACIGFAFISGYFFIRSIINTRARAFL